MSNSSQKTEHNRLIVDQFTAMAAPFAQMPAHSEEASLRLLCEAAKVEPDDRVLDVCCGTGIVSCALAAYTAHVTGIDITPAMIDQARLLQERNGLANITWEIGDVSSLAFPDGAFSLVLSRYAFHHLLDPSRVLSEMVRVCRPDGRVMLADVFVVSAEQGIAYDRVEKLRDPSHARALQSTLSVAIAFSSRLPSCRSRLCGWLHPRGYRFSPEPAFHRLSVKNSF